MLTRDQYDRRGRPRRPLPAHRPGCLPVVTMLDRAEFGGRPRLTHCCPPPANGNDSVATHHSGRQQRQPTDKAATRFGQGRIAGMVNRPTTNGSSTAPRGTTRRAAPNPGES